MGFDSQNAMMFAMLGTVGRFGLTAAFGVRNWLVGATLLIVCGGPPLADEAGRFEILNADYRVEDDMWVADVRAELELSDDALEALANSVALTIQYEFEVTRNRWFWTDKRIAQRRVNVQLSYLSLSQRYLVHYLDTGVQTSYATLYSALRQIGQFKDFPLIAVGRMETDGTYVVSLKVALNRDDLPSPLQMLAFWRGDYSLESKWNRWIPKQ